MPSIFSGGFDPSLLESTSLLMVVSLTAISLIFGLHSVLSRTRNRKLDEEEAMAMRFRHKREETNPQ